MPAALPVDWTAIKEAMIAGVTAPELAIRYGMLKRDTDGNPILRDGQPIANTIAIRTRCCREKWAVPQAIKERAAKEVARSRREAHEKARAYTMATMSQQEGGGEGDATLQHQPQALEIAAFDVVKHGERLQRAILPVLSEQTEVAMRDTPTSFRPTNAKELAQVVNIAWKLTGQDRPQNNTLVNLTGVWGAGAKTQEWSGGEYDV
jgi:hypothetical protein